MSDTVNRWKKLRIVLLILAGGLLVAQSFSIGLPIEGRIVDSATSAPLADVVILAVWKLHVLSPAGSSPGGIAHVREAVTDANGVFRLPAWLAIHRPLVPFSWYGRNEWDFPHLLIFRQGYRPKQMGNNILPQSGGRRSYGVLAVTWSSHDARTTALEPAPARSDEEAFAKYVAQVESFENDVVNASAGQRGVGCTWKKRAKMLRKIQTAAYDLGFQPFVDDGRSLIERCNESGAFQ